MRSHRAARELSVRLAAVAFQIHALGSREHVPVDVPQIVAFGVRAVLGELLAETEIRRPVQTRNEPVHHGLSDQLETGDRSEHSWIEKTLQSFYPFGAGLVSRMRLTMLS